MEVVPIVDDGKAPTDVLLFNRWSYDEIQVSDLSVEDYITATASKYPKFMPNSADVFLFNRWSYDEVQVSDLSVEDYVTATASQLPKFMPHSAGRYQSRRFSWKVPPSWNE